MSNKAYESDKEISYICTFKDEDSDEIDVKESENEKNVIFKSKVIRLNDGKELILYKNECSSNTCTYIFKTDYNGKYEFTLTDEVGNDYIFEYYYDKSEKTVVLRKK